MPRPCFNETVSLWGHTDPAYISCPIQKFLNVPRSQIPGEKPPHLVLFSNSQPGWRTYSHVLPPAKHWSCVFRSQHLHCTYVPGKSILTAHVIPSAITSCQDPAAQEEPAVQSHFYSPKPSHSHICAKGYTSTRKGKESPPKACRWEQLSPAQPLRKAGPWGRGLAGSSLAAFGPATVGIPLLRR